MGVSLRLALRSHWENLGRRLLCTVRGARTVRVLGLFHTPTYLFCRAVRGCLTKHPYFSPQPLLIAFIERSNAIEGFVSVCKCIALLFKHLNMPSPLDCAMFVGRTNFFNKHPQISRE